MFLAIAWCYFLIVSLRIEHAYIRDVLIIMECSFFIIDFALLLVYYDGINIIMVLPYAAHILFH